MNTLPRKPPSDDESIEERAAAWLAQKDGGFTDSERQAFERWREADPRHAAAVARLESMWAALQQLRSYRPAARVHPNPDLLAPRGFSRLLRFPRPVALTAVAAAAALALLAAWPRSHPSQPVPHAVERAPEVYTTAAGGYQRVALVDGSVLELNDQTEVRVRYSGAERRIHLVQGQAHFTVAKNPTRPFLVETAGVTVRAVGTAFDVRVGGSMVEVLVTEGVVQLQRPAAAAPNRPPAPAPVAEIPLLAAGHRAVVPLARQEAVTVETIGLAQMRQALSWQGPRLVFVETPLSEVVEQFNRHNQVQLSLADESLATLPVGGSFRAENVEAFVRLLASSGEITIERTGEDRIVLRRSR